MIMMRGSNLYIAIAGSTTSLDQKEKVFIDEVFSEIFGEEAAKVSDITQEDVLEVVYEIKKPVVEEGTLIKEFYENLEVLLEALSIYDPHFTQFKRGDIYA